MRSLEALLRQAFVLAGMVILTACPTDEVPDAPRDAGPTVVHDAGSPPDAGCAGQLGCACRNDVVDAGVGDTSACDRGQCVDGVCTLCTRGELGCGCRPDGSCLDGAVCREGPGGQESLCVECNAGDLGCACAAGACAEGLDCDDGTCVTSACPAGQEGCPCRQSTGPACDEGATCLGDGRCHVCDADQPGCPCVDDACGAGLVCGGTCREPISCQDLVDQGFCAPNQACGAAPGEDARCVEGECLPGFVFFDGACVQGRPNCENGAPGSLLDTCSAAFRRCVETDDGAHCGDCLGDAVSRDGACVGRLACGETSCFEDEYCDVTGAAPTCLPLPCAPGAALTSLGECQDCGFTCSGPGLTGRVWPFRSADGSCICETTPGYFMMAGGDTEAELCDQDGDGWIREETRDPALLIDGALVANARCGVSAVDTVVLRDEHGIDLEVVSCLEGLLVDPTPAACSQRVPMPLTESLRNDRPGALPVSNETPVYGERALLTSEVNGIMKACVDGLADFNDDGTADLVEVQAMPDAYAFDPASGEARLRSFAYFIETHRAYLETRGGRPRLVIEERRRCDPRDFPLRYDPGVDPRNPTDAYRADESSLYWRSCQRRVDSDFEVGTDEPKPGFDFAQWSCPDGAAGCAPSASAPPFITPLSSPTPKGEAPPDDATLCELGSSLPGDRVWRGMHHHSQFKCVRVSDEDVLAARPASDFGLAPGKLVMNQCTARDCPPGVASCLESRHVVPGSGAVEPVLDCRAIEAPANGQVGFAAVGYTPYGLGFGGGGYVNGCVNEDHEYRALLCPAPVSSSDPNWTVDPGTDGFGRQTCQLGPCPEGRADCDGDPLNGCEQDATLNESCGGCPSDPLAKCFPENGVGGCDVLGRCQIQECHAGWEDCNGDPSDGCETSLYTLTDCGACGEVCDVPSAAENCSTGVCEAGGCDLGTANCNGDLDDGCEADVTGTVQGEVITRCGGCGPSSTCSFPNAIPACEVNAAGDAYECVIGACVAGFADCDGQKENGCESNLLLDDMNCGGCGNDCGFDDVHATGQCVGGTCQVLGCDPPGAWGNCDQDDEDTDAFGCEVRLSSDVRNCGSCGNDCYASLGDTANPFCSAGRCAIDSCLPGRADCDSQPANGCERDLASASCGSAVDVGSRAADVKCGLVCTVETAKTVFYTSSGMGAKFFKARAVDAIGLCSEDLEHEVTLRVPSGVDYDLYVYEECGGAPVWSSATAGQGVDETVRIRRPDGTLDDRSFSYLVEVRWRSGGACAEWSISFRGRVPC